MACIGVQDRGQNSLSNRKTRIGYPWLSQTHPLKSADAEPSFRKVNLNPARLEILFSCRLESFDHKSTPSDKSWTEAYYPNF